MKGESLTAVASFLGVAGWRTLSLQMNPPTNPFLPPSFSFVNPSPNPNSSYLPFPHPNPNPNPNPNHYHNLSPHFSYPFFPPCYENPNPYPNVSHPPPLPLNFPVPLPLNSLPNPNPNTNKDPNCSYPPLPTDIGTAISTVKNLIDLAETALRSTADFLNLSLDNSPIADFCECPFDSRHWMPPESLFRHFLTCPSSPAVIDVEILDSLHYPHSFKSRKEIRHVRPLLESDADLCLSLDEYGDFGSSSFFYKDCHGVVRFSEQDTSKKMFTLPSILSIECANFIGADGDNEIKNLSDDILNLRILPSEFWAVRSELELWNDCPLSYSYTVLRVAACLPRFKETYVLKWIISNSPRYGIVIDVPMRDHMFLILKLCLKAIWREAFRSLESMLSRELIESDDVFDMKSLNFNCPRLVEVVGWLSPQLSLLYGDANAKLFAVNMIKQCFLTAGLGSLLFPLGQEREGAVTSREGNSDVPIDDKGIESVNLVMSGGETVRRNAEDEGIPSIKRNVFGGDISGEGQVFVSQVAAAIAALRERTLLEERIKDLRFGRPHSKFQLMNEHENLSMRAIEERGKRPDYRAILEHDGLLWQRSHNLDSSKKKTREELLAEERDYKRRRMSYRGKKVKRSKTLVMRDIIEEHMEEIKLAGGIGCFVKGGANTEMFLPGSTSTSDMIANVAELRGSGHNLSEAGRSHLHEHEKQVNNHCDLRSSRLEDARTKDNLSLSHGLNDSHYHKGPEHHVFQETLEDRKRGVSRDKEDRDHWCRSPQSRSHRHKNEEHQSRSRQSHRSHRRSHEHHGHRREHDDAELTRNKYERSSSFSSYKSRHRDGTPCSSSSNLDDFSVGKYDRMSESKYGYRGRTDRNQKSDIVTQNMFDDRYDPSVDDRYEVRYGDESSDSRYIKPDNT